MRHVQTVLGRVRPEELGRVMFHEHLLSLLPGSWLSGGSGDDRAEVAVRALTPIRELGFGTVIDQTPYGILGRDAQSRTADVLTEISDRTGLHIVLGSAIYLEPYSPEWAVSASVDEMTDRFVDDAQDTSRGVAAGIYGEQATGLGEITPHEEKCLRAVARAHRLTGLAISTHTTHGTMGLEQLGILAEEGADFDRVVIGHMDIQPDPDYVRQVLAAGASVAFDTIGKQFWDFVVGPPSATPEGEYAKRAYFRPDARRADLIAELVGEGHAARILLAQDLTGAELHFNADTQGEHGYAYLGTVFSDMLRARGVGEADLDQMLAINPTRLLTVA
jgi:predicted metal-dependent phosphotriesterase family hydrolase